MKIKLLTLISVVALSLLFPANTFAQSTPSFPACSNPSGSLKVKYDSGTHYIAGSEDAFQGSDVVYQTSENTLIQCFCPADGSGVQTNWWKIGQLTESEINTFRKLGWIYIPDGANWGLDATPYLAKNESFACGGGRSIGGGPVGAPSCPAARPAAPQLLSVDRNGASATIKWTKVDLATHYTISYGTKIGEYPYGVPNTGNVTSYTINALDPNAKYYFIVYAVNDCMPSEPSSNPSSQVLGLAATGNIVTILIVVTMGTALLFSGIYLRKFGRTN